MKPVFIIAEAGVNHNGNFNTAIKMIDAAKAFNADAIKFQSYIAEELVLPNTEKADYQKLGSDPGSQREMLKKYQLDFSEQTKLSDYAKKIGIEFISSPFDLKSLHFLKLINVNIIKIPSGEITNIQLLTKIAELKKQIILSTGMASITEISNAMAWLKPEGSLNPKVTILHCSTDYPTPLSDVNLNGMDYLKNYFQTDVGYSDHTIGIDVALAAVAKGATVIEKHFTLDKTSEGPDHRASLDIDEFTLMVKKIRMIEKILGNYQKKPSGTELLNKKVVRKSLVSNTFIKKGTIYTGSNLTTKRPFFGVCASEWKNYLGKTAKRDYQKDELIDKE